MAQQIINIGAAANDGTGDPVRDAFDKCNQNFSEVYGSGGQNFNHDNVVCAILRTAADGNWTILDDAGHTPINASSIVTDSNRITLTYGKTFNGVRSFVVVPDETLNVDLTVGASVSNSDATIWASSKGAVGGYVFYNGTTWDYATTYGVTGTPTFSAGVLTIPTFRYPGGLNAHVDSRDANYHMGVGSSGGGSIEIYIRDFTGALVTTPSTDMKLRFSCGVRDVVNLKDVRSDELSGGNFWVFGVFDK